MTASRPKLVLASASPRRLALLRQIGIVPDRVIATELDESAADSELPRTLAMRLARAKAEAAGGRAEIAALGSPALILSADTVVACGRRILPKAETEAQARRCLAFLSGRRHRVLTAIALAGCDTVRTRLVETAVRFKRLSEADIERYIQSGEWEGKAGGYAIQGLAAAFVPWIEGSYSNVVGLPLSETAALLDGAGYRAS